MTCMSSQYKHISIHAWLVCFSMHTYAVTHLVNNPTFDPLNSRFSTQRGPCIPHLRFSRRRLGLLAKSWWRVPSMTSMGAWWLHLGTRVIILLTQARPHYKGESLRITVHLLIVWLPPNGYHWPVKHYSSKQNFDGKLNLPPETNGWFTWK